MATVALERPGALPRPSLGRLSDRRSFGRLRRQGSRASSGGLSVVWAPPPAEAVVPEARVAFAVGRRAGGAVLRNRVRRRLRAGLAELATAGQLPAGDYVVSAGAPAATEPWSELCRALGAAVHAATAGRR